jgi:bacillithiol biosynthesis cysteine-adding enzyme BshC
MKERISQHYINNFKKVEQLFSFSPTDFHSAIKSIRPRRIPQDIAREITTLNKELNANNKSIKNCKSLENENVLTVITGQQVGFMGGPLYTLYKIITSIKLCNFLKTNFKIKAIPIFWAATEDHDFDEINHSYAMKKDNEVGKFSFKWKDKGASISEFIVNESLNSAFLNFLKTYSPQEQKAIKSVFKYNKGVNFADSTLKALHTILKDHGIVIVKPELLRPFVKEFFLDVSKQQKNIKDKLKEQHNTLKSLNYTTPLNPNNYGGLFTTKNGTRVRVEDHRNIEKAIKESPIKFSPDAALRPILADKVFPNIISVLGPGEIDYRAYLRPIYNILEVQQPLLFPRERFVCLEPKDNFLFKKYKINNIDELKKLSNTEIIKRAFPNNFIYKTDKIKYELKEIPKTAKTKEKRHIEEYNQESIKIQTKKFNLRKENESLRTLKDNGFTKGEIQLLRNRICPLNKPQERVFPLTHFYASNSELFLQKLLLSDIKDFNLKTINLEERIDD